MTKAVEEATELLQQLIRNRCVNDGTPDSGDETRNVETLISYLSGPGVDLNRYEPHPGRGSVVMRIEGRQKRGPTLLLMGHIDVVPADPTGWRRDPFGGELVEGEVWGRGAIDMLGITATMAVAVKGLLREGFRPNGTLIFSGMADEEALGTYGAAWLVEHAWDDVGADAVLTEAGIPQLPLPSVGGPKVTLIVAEKGSHWISLRVKGTPGHGSMPYKTDNALVKAAEVARRIAAYRPPLRLDGWWRAFVEAMRFTPPLGAGLLDTERFHGTIDALPTGIARYLDASTHTTFSPNILHAGVKTNIVPDSAAMEIDIRTVPGDEGPEVRAMLEDAIGDLWGDVEIAAENDNPASASPTDTPIFRTMTEVAERVGRVEVVPGLIVGATDSRFFRRKGVPAYGYSLWSAKIPFGEFVTMFHGRNERIDQESLRLMLELYAHTARAFLT